MEVPACAADCGCTSQLTEHEPHGWEALERAGVCHVKDAEGVGEEVAKAAAQKGTLSEASTVTPGRPGAARVNCDCNVVIPRKSKDRVEPGVIKSDIPVVSQECDSTNVRQIQVLA